MNMQSLTEEQRAHVQFIEQRVRERAAPRAAAPSHDYVLAAITGGLTTGPEGANFEGWITYSPENAVYLQTIAITTRSGLAAVGCALPVFPVLPAPLLVGKRATLIAYGSWGTGSLQLKLDGVDVFGIDVPLAGTGIGGWRVEGTVEFRRK